MLIAITSTGKELKSQMDSRFGRTKYIVIYNTDDSTFEAQDNSLNLNATQGAGIQTAQNVVELNAEILITGNCGPKAFLVLDAAKVKVFASSNTTVEEAIQAYLDNKLKELTSPNVEGHWT